MTKGPSLERAPGFLDCLLTHRPQIPRMSGFQIVLVLAKFLTVIVDFAT